MEKKAIGLSKIQPFSHICVTRPSEICVNVVYLQIRTSVRLETTLARQTPTVATRSGRTGAHVTTDMRETEKHAPVSCKRYRRVTKSNEIAIRGNKSIWRQGRYWLIVNPTIIHLIYS